MLAGSALQPHLPGVNAKPDTCPLCGKPTDAAHQPFCGRGCKDRDLLQWLGDGYCIPGPAAPHDKPLDSEDWPSL
jgi:uncharacterized protein